MLLQVVEPLLTGNPLAVFDLLHAHGRLGFRFRQGHTFGWIRSDVQVFYAMLRVAVFGSDAKEGGSVAIIRIAGLG